MNVAVLVLRRQTVEHAHYRAPTFCPILGFVSCAYLAMPFVRGDLSQYAIAGVLLLIGIALYTINLLLERRGAIDTGTSAG